MDKRSALRLDIGDHVIAQDGLRGYEGTVRTVTGKGGVLVEFGPYEARAGDAQWFPYHRINKNTGS